MTPRPQLESQWKTSPEPTRVSTSAHLSKVCKVSFNPIRAQHLTFTDYEQVCLRDPDWQPQYAATGNGIAIMANRISYYFNLTGPSMTIDTGCSGSLVSVHLAVQSLRTGDCSLVRVAASENNETDRC